MKAGFVCLRQDIGTHHEVSGPIQRGLERGTRAVYREANIAGFNETFGSGNLKWPLDVAVSTHSSQLPLN